MYGECIFKLRVTVAFIFDIQESQRHNGQSKNHTGYDDIGENLAKTKMEDDKVSFEYTGSLMVVVDGLMLCSLVVEDLLECIFREKNDVLFKWIKKCVDIRKFWSKDELSGVSNCRKWNPLT